jgi:biopolymer transport protein ExbD/biopolymer transport protein TolR
MRLAQRLKARIAADHKSDLYCHIDLAALLSISLVLLSVFMTVLPEHHNSPFDFIHLAKSNYSTPEPGALREDSLILIITRDGSIYFGNEHVAPEQIPGMIRARLNDGVEKRIYLGVDSRARYSRVTTLLDEVRLAGVVQITFIAKRDDQKP